MIGGGAGLEVVGEERGEDVLAEPGAGIGSEAEGAEGVGGLDLLAVVPGAHDDEDLVAVFIEGLDSAVDGWRAIDVLLIPEAVDEEDGDLHAFGGEVLLEDLVHGQIGPEAVIGGVGDDLAPEAELVHAALAAEFACGAGEHVGVPVVGG